jgi:uncharacterized membrane protein (DUF4010 family)
MPLAQRWLKVDAANLLSLQLYRDLAVGVGIGLVIGLERQWMIRKANPEAQPAGLRTFGLLAIAGCAGGLALRQGHEWVAAAVVIGAALVMTAVYTADVKVSRDLGATTEVAGLASVVLAAMAAAGSAAPAAALAVVGVILLGARRSLHKGVAALDANELHAVFRFLVLAAVILPLLPNRGYGPYEALNPYSIGFMVVLLSGLSFAGYWATRLLGARHGLLLTAAFGGLVSSTAVTLALARLSQQQELDSRASAAAITVATLVMFCRVLLLSAMVAPTLMPALLWPIIAALVVGLALTGLVWWKSGRDGQEGLDRAFGNPFELRPALFFAAILAVVTLGTRWAADRFGAGGVLLVSGITGLVDADSVIIANGRLAASTGEIAAAAGGILLATAINSFSKAAIALVVASRTVGLLSAGLLLSATAAGVATWFVINQL